MNKPERFRDNPRHYCWTTFAAFSGSPASHETSSGIGSQKGIRFRAALQAASLWPTYPLGVALGCYRGAPSARWTWVANPTFPHFLSV